VWQDRAIYEAHEAKQQASAAEAATRAMASRAATNRQSEGEQSLASIFQSNRFLTEFLAYSRNNLFCL
jgi:hypothetical protein